MKTFSFESIGTKWQIDIYDSISEDKLNEIKEGVFSFLEEFTNVFSRFEPNSLVSKIALGKGEYEFPDYSNELFSIYEKLEIFTEGKFTLLIGNTLESAGYDRNYSFDSKRILKPYSWSKVLHYKHPILSVKRGVILDFGACGKGFAIDRIVKLLTKHEIDSFIVDAGGDIYVKNVNGAKIGLENPANTKQVVGVSKINNLSICASALNRRKWKNYSHIIDPKSLQSPNGILAVWTISKKAVIADALATALFLDDAKKLQKEFEFEYLILKNDFSMEKSLKFPAEIYYNKKDE